MFASFLWVVVHLLSGCILVDDVQRDRLKSYVPNSSAQEIESL